MQFSPQGGNGTVFCSQGEPNRSPAKRVRFGKEEQRSERTVFFMQSIKIAASDTQLATTWCG